MIKRFSRRIHSSPAWLNWLPAPLQMNRLRLRLLYLPRRLPLLDATDRPLPPRSGSRKPSVFVVMNLRRVDQRCLTHQVPDRYRRSDRRPAIMQILHLHGFPNPFGSRSQSSEGSEGDDHCDYSSAEIYETLLAALSSSRSTARRRTTSPSRRSWPFKKSSTSKESSPIDIGSPSPGPCLLLLPSEYL